jgi:1-acyl-sn-glycerol-3-phosphate acyltransferase
LENWNVIRFWRSATGSLKLLAIFLYGALELIVRRPATYDLKAEWLNRFCARAVRATHIAVRVEGTFPDRGVLVSNHIGYLDVMVLATLHRCVFVAKAELATVPLLGWMTTMAGNVYVQRGQGGSAIRARSGLQAAFDAGVPIVIFPEGTTSDGSSVLKFHSGALGQVLEEGQPVTAAYVTYRLTEDNGPGITVQDDVAFWGDDALLFRHIFRLVALRGVEVSVRIADGPIAFTADAQHRKQAAIEARAAVMELGGVRDAIIAAP